MGYELSKRHPISTIQGKNKQQREELFDIYISFMIQQPT
jgi:hypothetical protein